MNIVQAFPAPGALLSFLAICNLIRANLAVIGRMTAHTEAAGE
eukprot:CAMPEP_0119393836 /NCGR_PEP_ID=MMETSP1334-20130426/126757_1 /TAXON_ID=127549 /ORGANISM="Calcidiscus leptoporus, Strain RCC1130" /LENGTH=42 /DNA_ID= /DNA_START= /DNA_END= /DNA_ORIENTATION=